MVFITVQFDYSNTHGVYAVLYNALKKSIEANMPEARLHSICVPPPKNPRAWKGLTSNTVKLDYWIKALNEIDDTEFIFIDCDMIVTGDMGDVFKKDFDICYTVRNSKFPINGGVVYVKKTEASLDFLQEWQRINDKMYDDKGFHEIWRAKYAGINQAAFGYMVDAGKHKAKLETVQCVKYNCTDEAWHLIDEDVRAIHIKGKLRDAVLGKRPIIPRYERAAKIWQLYGEVSSYISPVKIKKEKRPRPVTVNNTFSRW